jgi:hypothetical protein
MVRSKFSIRDIGGGREMQFIPKQKTGLFEAKIPTWRQFFDDIKHLGNVAIYFKGRLVAVRYLITAAAFHHWNAAAGR